MPRAELAIVIEEGGASPVGGPAPESVRSEGRAARSAAGTTSTNVGTDDAFLKGVLRFEGSVTDFVAAIARFSAKEGRAPEVAGTRAEAKPVGSRPVLEPAATRPGAQPEAESLKGAFKDLAGTFGVLGLLKAVQMAIRGFGELFFATEAVTRAKVQEAVAMRVRVVGERTIDGISRPTAGAGGDVPRIPTTALSTRVGPQDALGPVKPAGAGAAGGAAEAVTATAGMGRLAAGAAVATAGVALLGFAAKKAGDALDAQARNLSQFSPELARSTAQADIRSLRAEIDRAKAVGPGLARFQEDWSRMMATFKEMGTAMLEGITAILDLLRPAMRVIQGGLDIISGLMKIMAEGTQLIAEILTLKFDLLAERVSQWTNDIKAWMFRFFNEDPLEDEFAEQLLFQVGGLGGAAPQNPAAKMKNAFGNINAVRAGLEGLLRGGPFDAARAAMNAAPGGW